MRAGPLRHRVTLDYPLRSQSNSGEEVIAWTDQSTGSLDFWAAVEPMRGAEQNVAAQILAATATKIRIRWSPWAAQIDATWRARHGETIYNIVNIIHVNLAQREVHLICDSGRNDG